MVIIILEVRRDSVTQILYYIPRRSTECLLSEIQQMGWDYVNDCNIYV